MRAASWSERAGASLFALWLLEGYDPPPSLLDIDPMAYQALTRLERKWNAGLELDRIGAPDGREIVFRGRVRVHVFQEGGAWAARSEYPPAQATASGPWSAVRELAAALANECVRLVSRPTGRLSRAEVARKGLYPGAIELGLSQIGLPLQSTRWLLGKVDGEWFHASHSDLAPVPLGSLQPPTEEGMYFARVPVGRAGLPAGPVERLVPAGAGQSIEELLSALRKLVAEDDDAA